MIGKKENNGNKLHCMRLRGKNIFLHCVVRVGVASHHKIFNRLKNLYERDGTHRI